MSGIFTECILVLLSLTWDDGCQGGRPSLEFNKKYIFSVLNFISMNKTVADLEFKRQFKHPRD